MFKPRDSGIGDRRVDSAAQEGSSDHLEWQQTQRPMRRLPVLIARWAFLLAAGIFIAISSRDAVVALGVGALLVLGFAAQVWIWRRSS
jgi:hypothetical protein